VKKLAEKCFLTNLEVARASYDTFTQRYLLKSSSIRPNIPNVAVVSSKICKFVNCGPVKDRILANISIYLQPVCCAKFKRLVFSLLSRFYNPYFVFEKFSRPKKSLSVAFFLLRSL
jgi:hypothetical protein